MSWAGQYAYGFDIPRPRVCGGDVLYMDFDGVAHVCEVYVERTPTGRVLRPFIPSELASKHQLFEHAELLADLLQPYPSVRIVLSTTWVRHMGYRVARSYLPPSLRARCVGATYHSRMPGPWFDAMPRGQQVREDVHRRRPDRWLAIDDVTLGWGDALKTHLVASHEILGISAPWVRKWLVTELRRFA